MEFGMTGVDSCNIYIIQEGDSISSIAARYGVTAARILELNPYIDPANLTVNQPICVPEGERAPCNTCCPAGYQSYTVRYGQTYAEILIEHDLSYQIFRQANPQLSASGLLPGQRYCVPGAEVIPSCPAGSTRTSLPAGSTLQSAAEALRTTPGQLLRINPTLRPSEFTGGQQVCVPTGSLER